MRNNGLRTYQNIRTQLRRTIVIRIEQHQNPSILATFSGCQKQHPPELVNTIQESITTHPNGRRHHRIYLR